MRDSYRVTLDLRTRTFFSFFRSTHKCLPTNQCIKASLNTLEVNLPGIGDTVIKQAVPPGGDLCIALGQVEACDLPKRGRLGCAIFGSGGLRSRVPRNYTLMKKGRGKFAFCILWALNLCSRHLILQQTTCWGSLATKIYTDKAN